MKNIAVIVIASLLAACAYPPRSSSVYSPYQTQNMQVVRTGTVESVRTVTIANRQSGVGTLGGAALGGIAGNAVGGGNGRAATTVIGAIAGGLIGNSVEANANMQPGIEITVRLDSGEMVAVTQAADEMFRPGDRVRLLSSGPTTRVSH